MRILIVSASTGSGHMRAAQALEQGFRTESADNWVRHINVLDFVTPAFKHFYQDGYDFLVRRFPQVWGKLYDATDKVYPGGRAAVFFNRCQLSQAEPFFRLIDQFQPQVIVATHFLVAQLLSMSRHARIPLEVVVTDFRLHRIWLHPSVRRYYVAAPDTFEDLVRAGVEQRRVVVTGIPIDASFGERTHLYGQEPAVVVMGGGAGVGELGKTVAALSHSRMPMRIMSIAGRNPELQAQIATIPMPSHIKLTSMGFVSNMAQVLANARLIVTKAGGLTVSECLAMGVPMVLFPCLPGQETANADYVVNANAGLKADSLSEAVSAVETMLKDPSYLAHLSRSAADISTPRAASTIARQIRPAVIAA